MKKKYIYFCLIFTLALGCSRFSENLTKEFLSSEEVTISDFNTEFPVIDITVNQEEFDNMYLNYEEDIEIEGFLNLYRSNTLLISDELVEIEIKGSKSAAFNLKSLGIKFDDTFDNENNVLLNPEKTLKNHSLEEIKAFRLRNSGNDFKDTLLKDISYTQLAIDAGLDIDLTYYEPAIVFINNIFSGIMNLRSEANTNGVSRLNDTKKKNITLAKINTPGEVEKKDGDFDRIDNFLNAIDDKNLDYLKQEVDIGNFIDYMVFQSYIANIDWPYNNVRFYAISDEPFRFVMFDLDLVNTRKIKDHPLDFIKIPSMHSGKNGIKNPITDLFNVLYGDADFKAQFTNRYEQLINDNAFSTDKFNSIVDKNLNAIHEYMPIHLDKYTDINTMFEWYRNIDILKENFKEREEQVKSMMLLFE
ncbi:MAG: CotH kinase family protein [Algibacter sp.]